jgi:hypothetical protein
MLQQDHFFLPRPLVLLRVLLIRCLLMGQAYCLLLLGSHLDWVTRQPLMQQALTTSLLFQVHAVYLSHLLLHVLHWVYPPAVQDVEAADDCCLRQP